MHKQLLSPVYARLWYYIALFFILPLTALAQGTDDESVGSVLTLIERLARLVNPLIALLSGFAVLAFVRGIAVFIWNAGDDEKRKEGKKFMIWGIVGLFVLIAFWGIVKIITILYFGDAAVGLPFAPL